MIEEKKQEAQGMIEYALIIGLISIIVVAVLIVLGPQLKKLYTDDSEALNPAKLGAHHSTISTAIYN